MKIDYNTKNYPLWIKFFILGKKFVLKLIKGKLFYRDLDSSHVSFFSSTFLGINM